MMLYCQLVYVRGGYALGICTFCRTEIQPISPSHCTDTRPTSPSSDLLIPPTLQYHPPVPLTSQYHPCREVTRVLSSHLSRSLVDRRGTTVDFTTSFLHSSLVVNSRPTSHKRTNFQITVTTRPLKAAFDPLVSRIGGRRLAAGPLKRSSVK